MDTTIRVMIVDDSLVVRRLVEDSLREVPGIAVVGTASNGKIALDKLAGLAPDLVTLDVEMPELDGLATLKRIKALAPRTHVIMFSSLTGHAAAATVEALAAGASDYVQKPTNTGGMNATRERIRDELVPKVRALCAPKPAPSSPLLVARPPAPPPLGRVPTAVLPRATTAQIPLAMPGSGSAPLVAIGVSTGGPAALHALLEELPAGLAAPVLIVQHMPPAFASLLARRLASACRLPVQEAVAGAPLAPGKVWLAPGDHHLAVVRRGGQLVLDVHQGPPEHSCRPAVDVLFRSVAAEVGPRALAVVLTGMGHDGLEGCRAISAAGGTVLVQDASSSVVWGMPGAVARAGLADRVVPLAEMAGAIRLAVGTVQGASPAATSGGLRART